MNKDTLITALRINSIEYNNEQLEKLSQMAELLVDFNLHTNLTSITDDNGVAVKHIADCLKILPYLDGLSGCVADIGAGGGFPTLPLAIMRPDLQITAVDSTAKKLEFVRQCAEKLSLNNVTILCGRAEELAKSGSACRESFDIVTARAVADMKILCELCVPFIKVGGMLAVLKGDNGENELSASKDKMKKLGLSKIEGVSYKLNDVSGELYGRYIIKGRKAEPTQDIFPRNYNKIKAKP